MLRARHDVRQVGALVCVSVLAGFYEQGPGRRDLQGDAEQEGERQQVQAAALPGQQADPGTRSEKATKNNPVSVAAAIPVSV